jgi:hypothetical protein
MSKVKVVLLGLVAVLAISAGTTSTASAAHVFKIEGTELAGTEAAEATSFSGKLENAILGLSAAVQCEEDVSGPSEIKPKGESKGSIEFKNCFTIALEKGKRTFLTSCSIKEPVVAQFTDQLTEHGVDEYKGSGAEEAFFEIEIKGESCAIKSKYKVKGRQDCSTPEAEFEKVIRESICTPAGSKLTQKSEGTENTAQLFGTDQIKLKSAKNWSAS